MTNIVRIRPGNINSIGSVCDQRDDQIELIIKLGVLCFCVVPTLILRFTIHSEKQKVAIAVE